jgi:hypothetical protein
MKQLNIYRMKGRNVCVVVLILLFSGSLLFAQDSKPVFGIRAGGSFSGFTNHQDVFTGMRSGFFAGGFFEFKAASFLGIALEANYVQEGAFHANPFLIYSASSVNYTTNIYKTTSDVRIHTLQVPLLFNIRAPKINGSVTPKLILGYSFDYIIKAVSNDMYMISAQPDLPLSKRGTENVSSSFQSWYMAPVCGVGIDFPGEKVTYMLEARYSIGLRNINNLGGLNTLNSQYDFSVNTFAITLGIGF